jgi:hypothetical protein
LTNYSNNPTDFLYYLPDISTSPGSSFGLNLIKFVFPWPKKEKKGTVKNFVSFKGKQAWGTGYKYVRSGRELALPVPPSGPSPLPPLSFSSSFLLLFSSSLFFFFSGSQVPSFSASQLTT